MSEPLAAYRERGWNVVRKHAVDKRPDGRWKDKQHRLPTDNEWRVLARTVEEGGGAVLLTGTLSDVVVLDLDTPEAVEQFRDGLGSAWDTIPRSTTPRGTCHLFFGGAAGVQNAGCDGFDVRGEGGVAVLPTGGADRAWEVPLPVGPLPPWSLVAGLVASLGKASPSPRVGTDRVHTGGGGLARFETPPAPGTWDNTLASYAGTVVNWAPSEAVVLSVVRDKHAAWLSEVEHPEPMKDGHLVQMVAGLWAKEHAAVVASSGSWDPVDLRELVDRIETGELVGPRPSLLLRSDGQALLYAGEVHSVVGEPESCKGWIAVAACVESLAAGDRVLYLDFEDGPASVLTRLLLVGADPGEVLARFVYVQPEADLSTAELEALLALGPFRLAIVDGLQEAYSLLRVDEWKEPAKFLQRLSRPIAKTGAAVLQIDHVVKSNDARGRYAIGGQGKLAGVAVQYGCEVVDRPSETSPGTAKLTMLKDRHGGVPGKRFKTVALVHVDCADGPDKVRLVPDDSKTADGGFRPTWYMDAVSRALEDHDGQNSTELRKVVGRTGKHVTTACRALEVEGFLRKEERGRSFVWRLVKPFREGEEGDVVLF